MKKRLGLTATFALSLCAALGMRSSVAQDAAVVEEVVVQQMQTAPSGYPGSVQVVESPFPPGQKLPPGVSPPSPHGGPPPRPPSNRGADGKDPTKPGSPGTPGAPGEEAKPSGTIKRTDRPQAPADPKEFDVRPGPDGVVIFQFRGQNWPDLLQWYAEIAGVSVDWLELPGDYLNISTQRGYKVAELGELLNRLLLARGFTMLPQGDFINVVKCEEVSASLVPRVRPEDLDKLGEYDFVRVMFELDWMLAEEATTELDPLLSQNGKLFPLKTTNRIEAMDSVCNLREIHRLLTEEQQSDGGESRLVQEFILVYARADDVRESLSEFLGVSGATNQVMPGMSAAQMAKQQQQMMQQMQQQMQQQMAAAQQRSSPSSSPSSSRSRRSTPSGPSEEMPVRMMVNSRRNSLIVQAPADKMATIAQAIKLMDVPEQGASSLQAFLGRMQVYRLASLDPQKLVNSLRDLGGLDPSTRLEVDDVNRAIIAYATPADHFTIRSTVEKLDGSARRVEVIPLRRLAADEVAGTIQYLMAGSSEKSSSRPDYMDYIYGYSSRRSSSRQEKPADEFRVDADVANNRLLVKANDMELEEVVSILVKLGEVPQVGRNGDMTRVLDIVPGDDADEFLKRLQRDFKVLAPNALVLPEPEKDSEAEPQPVSSPTPTAPAREEPAKVEPEETTASLPAGLYRTALFQHPDRVDEGQQPSADRATTAPVTVGQQEEAEQPGVGRAAEQPGESGPPSAAPIIVSIGPDGRLVIASRDTQALELLEQLATRTAPPSKDYHIFTLEHAMASWVVLNLEDFFEDKDAAEDQRRNRMSWIYGMPSSSSGSDERRLSKRKPLKFITDLDTNTILVQGADSQQLKTIADLIKLYDVPEPVNSQNARVTKLFTVKYSRASIVADTIKDAYRDLLSSNDRALQNGGKDQGKQQPRGGGMTVISAFGLGESSSSPTDTRTSARFEGKLSIGVDDLSNTMLVTTEGDNLMSVVEDMITALDEAAKPVSEVRVVKLGRHLDGSRLQDVLQKVLRAQAQPGQVDQQANPQAKPPSPPPGGRNRRPGQPPQVAESPF